MVQARHEELHGYLESGNDESLRALAREFLEVCRLKGTYDQVRFLDEHGME